MDQSFVKNVTSRVSSLLPATITKWFSSPKSSANGSAPAADATASSTEDEAPESPASGQPPAKRMRYSAGTSYGNTDANCVTSNIETTETSTPYTVQSPPGRTTFRRETNYVLTPIRSPEESTIDRTDKDTTETFQQHTVTTIGPSVAKKGKSLFGNQSQELSDASKRAYVETSNNTVKDPKQPSFEPTLLGSPFYAGRTTYGGAASSYINQHQQLEEAKRIPHYTRPTKQELMKKISESSMSSPYNKVNSFKTQELHVPSIASILRLKQRSRLNDTTNAARQLVASHSSTSPDYTPYPSSSKIDQSETDGGNKLTTKVKSRLTRPNRGDTNSLDTDTLPPVDLPKAVLQVDPNNLPNFSGPIASKTPQATEKKETKTETALRDWKCPDCWINNKQEADKCACCGYKLVAKPSSNPKCSLCKLADSQANSDKCVNCDKVQVNNISKPLKADTSKWNCEDCWVSNDEAADKCVCCGANNPKGASQVVPVKTPQVDGMCPKCFAVTSDGKCSKCTQSTGAPEKTFKIVLKTQANKWECEHCLVRNDSDKTKCVCCEAERSGKHKEPEKKQFNFGTMNTTFKFGIDPKVQEANLAKAAENPVETKDKLEESETNNNVLAKAPTFSFGIPATKSEDQPDATKKKPEETVKTTFTFSIPKQNAAAPTPAPMFGIPNKINDASKDKAEAESKPQEVKPAEEAAKPPVVMFGATSTPATNSAAPSQPILSTSFTLEKKETPSNPLSLSTASVPVPVVSLTFTAPKPATGMFGTIVTTAEAPPASINFSPIITPAAASMFQKTDNTSKPMSMFQKSDPPTTATVSLFQKSEAPATAAAPPPATAAAPPPAATAPMFSFGSAQSAQPQADKPKFNFTFGGNKTDNVFKPPTFGASDPNNAMNKFILNAAENPLGAVNPLAPGNSLTGNSMTSNGLPNNSMSGNGMQAGALATTSMFGSVQMENMWSPPNSSSPNLFVANAPLNNAPKPFSFGTSTPFNSSAAPTCGAVNTQASSTPVFGAAKMAFGSVSQAPPAFGAASPPAPAPAFGSNVQSTPNIFGINNQNNQPSMFSTPNQNATAMFGSPQQPAPGGMPPPSMGMFGRPNVGAAPAFGTPNSIPTFGAPSLTPAQAPAFNFGSTPSSGIFGFGQQPQPGANLGGGQTGVHSFGAPPGAQAQVQFSMGSAPNAAVRRSFVKNVTSRVSSLLPATITKWFSSPKSSANGSAPAADATASSTEDEAPESPASSQPPAKRMRYSAGTSYGNTDANCVTSNIETTETSTPYTVQSPPGRTTFRRETNYVSTPIRSPEESTIDRTDKDTTETFQQHTVTTIGPSVAKKRNSLFGNQSQELSDASKKAYVETSNNTVKDPKQPSFEPALLGSPFYAGRTTYGGAASSYINQHQQLEEAKRIPHYTRPTRQELMKKISESSMSSPYNKVNSFKTQELHVPSIASILRLKQRSRLNDTVTTYIVGLARRCSAPFCFILRKDDSNSIQFK